MLALNFVRENIGLIKEKMEQRGTETDLDKLVSLDEQRRELLTEADSLKHKRNLTSEKIALILLHSNCLTIKLTNFFPEMPSGKPR